MPAVEVPHATYLGWNQRREGHAQGALCSTAGSYIPFAKTQAEREAAANPRLSIAERYSSQAAYVDQVKAAVNRLQDDRLLLEEDAKRIVEELEARVPVP